MDAFNLIQSFFTRMHCNFCSHSFEPDDIQLIRQDEGIFIVNVYCHHCNTQNGVAMVGVELPEGASLETYTNPELTAEEVERFAHYQPIQPDDVIEAHRFFQNLDADWMKFIPPETLERCTVSDTEDPDE